MPDPRPFSLEDLYFNRLEPASRLKPFDCNDDDLNDFFHNDSLNYIEELLAVTYTFETADETVAFFSVLNDKIINKDSLGRTIANRLIRRIPNPKRRPSYPAVKIGRLGVHAKYKRIGYGTDILDFIKHWFTDGNKTGCRFITVDAYNCPDVTAFYQRNGFRFLTESDRKKDTRQMWFDLMTFRPG